LPVNRLHRLVEDIAKILKEPVTEVAFILVTKLFLRASSADLENLAKSLAYLFTGKINP
jgi:glucose-1-phosphate thymidylyltransferase